MDPTVKCTSFGIGAGEIVLLVGESGSGKTTLLKLMAGLLHPQRGQILINTMELDDLGTPTFQRRITYLSQSESIYPLSLKENLLAGLGSAEERERIGDLSIKRAMIQMGCDYLSQHRFDKGTILTPCQVVGQSIYGCGNGDIGQKAIYELKSNDTSRRSEDVSPTERQRLIA